MRLTEQLAGARQRLEERESSASREQARTEALLETLRTEYSHTKSSLEERYMCVLCVCTYMYKAL